MITAIARYPLRSPGRGPVRSETLYCLGHGHESRAGRARERVSAKEEGQLVGTSGLGLGERLREDCVGDCDVQEADEED